MPRRPTRIQINPISPDDAGLYMCQVSTHPPRVFATNLTVLGKNGACDNKLDLKQFLLTAPAIILVDEMAHEVSDRYYKLGSSVDISCQVALSFLNTIPSPTTNSYDRLLSPLAVESTTKAAPTTTIFPFIDINLIKKTIEQQIPYSGKHNIKWKKDGKDLPKDIKINLRFVRCNQIFFFVGSCGCRRSSHHIPSLNVNYKLNYLPTYTFSSRKQHNTHLAK